MTADSSAATVELHALLAEARPDPSRIAALLDGLAHEQRVAAVRTLGRAQQRALYRAVDGFRPLGLTDLVPSDVEAFATVRHYGRNTLPAF